MRLSADVVMTDLRAHRTRIADRATYRRGSAADRGSRLSPKTEEKRGIAAEREEDCGKQGCSGWIGLGKACAEECSERGLYLVFRDAIHLPTIHRLNVRDFPPRLSPKVKWRDERLLVGSAPYEKVDTQRQHAGQG